MLRPQDNGVRETKKLDGLWQFAVDWHGTGRADGWWRAPLRDARAMPVPASYNDVLVDRAVHDHVGDVWYQRDVFVPRSWEGQRIVLRFDSATHRATVWVDDEQVAEHEGGYTPFEADITSLVQPGEALRVTLVVNNELSWESLPPGLVETLPNGARRQRYFHDFFNYAGLHRSAWMHSTSRAYIADITVVTDIDDGTGVVRCATVIGGEHNGPIQLVLRDAAGTAVAGATGADADLPRTAGATLATRTRVPVRTRGRPRGR